MKSATLFRAELDALKAKWPCHGLPDTVSRFWAKFDAEGNLVDLNVYYSNGRPVSAEKLEPSQSSGIMRAMVEECEGKLRGVKP